MKLSVRVVSMVIGCLSLPAAAAEGGSGEVTMRGATWKATDAVAFEEDGQTKVAFSNQPFDRKKMASDGKLNIFDVLRHDGQTVTLNFDADGPSSCIDFYVQAGDVQSSGSSCDSSIEQAITISKRDAAHIAGSIDWKDDDESIKLSWDVALESIPASSP